MDTLEIEKSFNEIVRRFFEENPSYRCPITGLLIDIDSNANEWIKPTEIDGVIMSWLGRVILNSGISAKELKKAVNYLLEKEKK